jgi:hypothetical protein
MSRFPLIDMEVQMNSNNAAQYDEADDVFSNSMSDAEPDDMSSADDDDLRLTRIAEYGHEALRKDDALRANLAALNAGLLEIAFRSEIAVKNSIQSAGVNILKNPDVQRALRTHLIIARQVDRYANLDVRLEEAEQRAENAKSSYRRH